MAETCINMRDDERLDDLQRSGLRILQKTRGFRFGTDAVLLADFAVLRRGDRVCDMGTGTGVLPLLLSARNPGTEYDAFELQNEMADMAKRSVALNGLSSRIRVHECDMRDAAQHIGYECCDAVVTNPPYTASDAGLVSPGEDRALSRTGSFDLTEWIAACSRVLRFGGKLFTVFPAYRFLELCRAMQDAGIEPKRVRFVVSRPEKPPKLVLTEGIKGGGKGLLFLPFLITHTADGAFTGEMKRIYGETL